MRILLGLLVVGAVIGGIVTHRHHEETPAPVTAPALTAAAAQPAAIPRQPSAHNWAKSALDRAGDVKRQVAEQRKQNSDE
ncbi:MAG: hypothetical protein M3Y03_04100 [Verrucomicrobiota bacterium]|nr:hypothetical protein [Verrucomicrobiota bacterium]